MESPQRECGTCILHEGILGVTVDETGTCNFCRDPSLMPSLPIPESDRERFEVDLEQTLAQAKGQGECLGTEGKYDITMGFSGGKDSTYLLYQLQEEYGLKVLAVAIDMGFMTKIAKDNITQAASVLGIDVIWREDVAPYFLELYKWIFAHRKDSPRDNTPYGKMLTGRTCPPCSDLLEGFVIQEAAKRNIPLVVFGLSPDQNARFTYEIESTVMRRTWEPEFAAENPDTFSHEFHAAWWDPTKFDVTPRVLLPYHAWQYNEGNVIAKVEQLGLIPPKKADPLVTNCDVLWAFSVYDARAYGCNGYIFPFARLVREGKADRDHWKKVFSDMVPALREGLMREPAVRKFYTQLGLTLKDVFELGDSEKVI